MHSLWRESDDRTILSDDYEFKTDGEKAKALEAAVSVSRGTASPATSVHSAVATHSLSNPEYNSTQL